MYLRPAHAELHIPTLRQFIIDNPLGILTTAIASPHFPRLQCTHIPFLISTDACDPDSAASHVLRGHLARANPHAQALSEACVARSAAAALEEEVMVLFHGPAHHYVTPHFYTATKPATGKVVPTWDYAAVQAYGKATVYFDAHAEETVEFLKGQLEELSEHAETRVMGYGGGEDGREPWKVSEAPEKFIDLLRKAIIGIRIDVTRLEGRFKMSQELGVADREGVIRGFQELGTTEGEEMAQWVKQRGEKKDAAKVDSA